jgi:hypothetical protein
MREAELSIASRKGAKETLVASMKALQVRRDRG